MPDLLTQLRALKLHGMADSYAELESQGAHGATATLEASVWLLRHLIEAESTDRVIRSIYCLSDACSQISDTPQSGRL